MTSSLLQVNLNNRIATIYMDSPPANTLSKQMIQSLQSTFLELAQDDDIHAIILTGSGRFFVAGADIKEFQPIIGNYEQALQLSKEGQKLCSIVEGLHKPVIAAINGPALGGGLELALSCHYRIAADDCKIGLPEIKLGLLPSFGGTQRLRQLIGAPKALQVILSGEHFTSQQALELGMIQVSTSKEELLPTANRVAESFITGHSYESIRRIVECIVQGKDELFEVGLNRESERFAELFLTNDAREGIEAFINKRAAYFKHQ